MLTVKILLAAILLVSAASAAQLGSVDFPNSGDPAAQPAFVTGLLLLHSFEYEDAREQFQKAEKIDPNFAMAYWGEAMTFNHPLWMEQNQKDAVAALQRLPPSAPTTQREKDYLAAVRLLYSVGTKADRDRAYAEAMRKVYETYPQDLDAACFYALALMGACEYERQFPVYMRAAAIVEEVFAKNPNHPGAAHYLIHAYDDPVHAPLGLRAARVYATIAGDASHAQHMPSHIFIALGMWDQVAASNEASIRVADERRRRKGLSAQARNYHSLGWLTYAYLQQGRNEDAAKLILATEKELSPPSERTARTMGALAEMRAYYGVETGLWNALPGTVDEAPLSPYAKASMWFTRGMAAVSSGQIQQALEAAHAIRQLAGGDAGKNEHAGMQMAPPKDAAPEIMALEVEAAAYAMAYRFPEAIAAAAKAAQLDQQLPFEFGPPSPPKPAHELYGEVLLKAGKTPEAVKQFQLTLERFPKRRITLRDLAQASL